MDTTTRVLTHEVYERRLTPVMSLSDTLLRLHGNRDDDTYRGLEAIHATSKSLISFVESYRSFTRIPRRRWNCSTCANSSSGS